MNRLPLGLTLASTAVVLSFAPAALAWEDPRFIAPRSATDTAIGPDVAVDDAGRALATWMQSSDPTSSTQWRARAATLGTGASTWSLLPPLSPAGARIGHTALGVAGGGAAVAAWTEGGNGVLKAARGSTTTGAFGEPTAMGGFGCPNNPNLTDDNVVGPVVALSDGGSGHIAWTAPCGNTDNGRWVLFRQITNDGFATVTKSAGHNDPDALAGPVGPQLATDPVTGGSRALFKEAEFPSPLVGRDLIGNEAIGAKQTLVPDSSAIQERLGILPDGKQIVLYRTGDAIRVLVDGVNTRLSPEGQSGLDPQLAVSADGTVVAAWFAAGGYWAAVRHPADKTWGPAHPLSDDEGEPRELDLAISDEGTAYAVWRRDPGDLVNVEAAILDPDDATRSPGKPYQFQPTPETVFDAGREQLDGDTFSGDAATPRVTVTPGGDALVVFRFVVHLGPPARHAIGWVRHLRTPPKTGGGNDDGGDGGGGSKPGDTTKPAAPAPAPPAAGPPLATFPPPPLRDLRAPRLTAMSFSRNLMALGRKEGRIVGKIGQRLATGKDLRQPLRVGNRLRWTADEPGTAFLTIAHSGCYTFTYVGEAVKPSERCPRKKDGVVFVEERPSKLGGNTMIYRGQVVGGKRLRVAGIYKATLRVVDAAGNSSAVRTASFRVDEMAERD